MNGKLEIIGLVDATGNAVFSMASGECVFQLFIESWRTTDSDLVHHNPFIGRLSDNEDNSVALLRSIPEDAVVRVVVNFDKITDNGYSKQFQLESTPTVVTDDKDLNALAANRHIRLERQIEGIGKASYDHRLRQWECKLPKRKGAKLSLHCSINDFDALTTRALSTLPDLDDLLGRSVDIITNNLRDWIDSETDDATDLHTLNRFRKSLRLSACDLFADGRVSLSFSGDKTLLRNHRVKADWTPDLKDCNVLLYG